MANKAAPATKGDLQEAVQGAVEQLRSEMNHHYDNLKETLRDSEPKLLKAFYSFAESNQHRLAAEISLFKLLLGLNGFGCRHASARLGARDHAARAQQVHAGKHVGMPH